MLKHHLLRDLKESFCRAPPNIDPDVKEHHQDSSDVNLRSSSETDGDNFEDWLGKTLDEDEVKEAQFRLQEMHPLKNEPLTSIFPFIKWFKREKKSLLDI